MTTTITPETPSQSTFFTSVPVPDPQVSSNPDTFVDVASRYMRQLGLYYDAGTVPASPISIMLSANSRNAGVNSFANRLWSRNWTHGYARWFWSHLIGTPFAPADIISRSMVCIDVPATPWTNGTAIGNARSDSRYADLAHFGFGSYSSTIGPGGGVAMFGSNAFTAYMRDGVNANLPSKVNDMFGTGGEYEGPYAITGDSLAVNSAEMEWSIYYLRGPGMGTFRWEHVTGAASSDSGTYTPGDPTDTSIDADNTTFSYLMGASDTMVGSTFTFNITPIDFQSLPVGSAVTHHDGATFGGIGIIVSKTSSTFTIKWAFNSNPTTGDTLYFGPASIGKASYTMPTTASEFRGARMTALVGPTYILGYGAMRTDVGGFGFGTHGWSGNGYGNQMDEWPTDDWYGQLCASIGVDLAILHIADQGSTSTDMVETLPNAMVAASPSTEIYLAGDPQHTMTDAHSYNDAILAQTAYAGSTCIDSQMCGQHMAGWEMGHKDNQPHPNVIGHAEAARVHLHVAANLSAPVAVVPASGLNLGGLTSGYKNAKLRPRAGYSI